MAHAQKQDFVFRWNGRVHLNRRGRQFSRLLAAEVCASAIAMLHTPYSEVVCRVLATHSIRQFPLHFPSRASPCVITFQLESTASCLIPLPHPILLGVWGISPSRREVTRLVSFTATCRTGQSKRGRQRFMWTTTHILILVRVSSPDFGNPAKL